VHDRHERTTERVSVDSFGAGGNSRSGGWSFTISADGRFVVFESYASNLVANETNNPNDVFVHDRHERTTERVSTGLDDYWRFFYGVAISADGRIVAFGADPVSNICATCRAFVPYSEVFVHDRQQQRTELVSVYADGSPIIDEDYQYFPQGSWRPAVSADGQIVVFGTRLGLVFVHDRRTGLSQPINLPSGSRSLYIGHSYSPHAISADGRFVVSSSGSFIRVHDLVTGRTEALGDGIVPSISHDGRLIAFQDSSPPQVFVRVR
jgi:Tol biopolymer transport system component